jgi:hypothetical protein
LKPKKKKVIKKAKAPSGAEVLAKALDVLRMCNPNAYDELLNPPQPEEEEYREPFDTEAYCEEMQQAVSHYVGNSKLHAIMAICKTYAVICKKVGFNVHISINKDSMQPYEGKEDKSFCIVKILAWDDSVRDLTEVADLLRVSAEYHEVLVAEDVRDKM